ncbi:MAG: hypothetical protein AMXMBFR64_09390 [Myxococcales bacterium]
MSPQPEWFGRYQLVRRVSIGGMAEVFQAKSYGPSGFEKEVALKRILPSIAEDHSLLQAFIDEARLAAQLHHPNICSIYELGKTFESYYITMEYIYGVDLLAIRKRLKQRGVSSPACCVAFIGALVAEGLHYAWTLTDEQTGLPLRIVHRDISPQNVMVSYAGDVKIIDFGIAKVAGRSSHTRVGVVKGKASYMAPEQVASQPLDGRADQFALGIILWELLAGERLFRADNPVEAMAAIRRCEIPPLGERRPDLAPGLVAAVHRALSLQREDRFHDAGELAAALAPHAGGSVEQGRLRLVEWLDELFPETELGAPALTETEVQTLFGRAEGGTDQTPGVGPQDGTQIFIPDTAQIDLYRAQIEALLQRQRGRGTGSHPSGGALVQGGVGSGLPRGIPPREAPGEFLGDALLLVLLLLGLGAVAWWLGTCA